MRKGIATVGVSAVLVAGGAGALAFAIPSISSAQSGDTTSTTSVDPTDPGASRSSRMAEALAPLVADGTISQTQADAVIAALEAAGPKGDGPHREGMGRGGPRPGLEGAATALGVTPEELMTALRDGRTLADVAADKGVDVATVVDAIVADAEAHLAEEVAAGEITQEEADARAAELTAKVTEMVNGTLPAGPGGHGGRGPGRMHPGPGADGDDAPATTAPSGFSTSTSGSVRAA